MPATFGAAAYDNTISTMPIIVNVSKSTVHKDLHERLYDIDKNLFKKVDKIMQDHLEIRHINGGNATKMKYEKLRKG